MNLKRRYKFTIEDETHLHTVIEKRIPLLYICIAAVISLTLLCLLAMLISISPLGYLLGHNRAEYLRVQNEALALRIDSLNRIATCNQAWINNFISVADLQRTPTDSALHATVAGVYNPDSLPDASPIEARFVSDIAERERFNISVLAPLDADGMAFAPVAPQAFVTAESRKSPEAIVLFPSDTPAQAIADGTVLAVFNHPSHGFTILLQHGRGFASSISHLGVPLVNVGDAVNAGQPIAFAPAPNARRARWIKLRVWHNGSSLIPFDIIP